MPRALDVVDSGQDRPGAGGDVANLERVANLDGQADNHSRAIDGVRIEIAQLRGDIATRGDIADLRMATRSDIADLRMATRVDIADLRVATRSDIADLRADMSRRFEVMDSKINRHFAWLVGIIVTGFIAVIGALVGMAYR